MLASELNHHIQDIQKEYLDFLDDEEDQGAYHRRVKEMIENKRIRMLVNMTDLRQKKPERATSLMKNASEEQLAFQTALKHYVATLEPSYNKNEFYIGYEGSFGFRHVSPRTLTSSFINNIVCLEGIVIQCSLVRPKLTRSVHYCPTTKKMSERLYSDFTSLNPMASTPIYPTKDIDGNLLETEYGLSSYKDHQTLTIQEMPEKAPAGQLPRSVDVICENDLADKCKPGDRVQIVGIYQCLPSKQNGFTTGIFRTILLACNITMLSKDTKIALSRTDIANCRKLAKQKDIFDRLSHSLAPSIIGHEYVKKAILCLLLGGVEKVLANGTRLRGDINVLMIGDPSVAKSQLLRYVLCTAPRAIATTGRGSSGVGLTAAVTNDQETGEKRLEAGAMVLADRGVVCIDEFDKMSDIDRTAIHEVMEQGRVTIAKAGIHAQLNARCSVLAAANPVYGKYNPYKPPMENIGLQDSLLSRFDLLFVMLDTINTDVDTVISDHVVRMHRYRKPGEPDGAVLPMGSDVDIFTTHLPPAEKQDKDENLEIYEKYDSLLHGKSRSKSDRIFTIQFMRMYIHIAKSLKPILGQKAADTIAQEYARIRSQDAVEDGCARTQPVTVRTLETLIRLASAHAKARLSSSIELQDANVAIELVQFAYFKKVLEKDKKRRRKSPSGADTDEDDDDEIDEEINEAVDRRRKKMREDTDYECVETETDMEESIIERPREAPIAETEADDISTKRLQTFRLLVSRIFQDLNVQTLNKDILVEKVNTSTTELPFSGAEVRAALKIMTEANQVMVADNVVFLI